MPTRNAVIKTLSPILPYDRGPFVVVTAYIMMITMCLCVFGSLGRKIHDDTDL